MSVTPDPADPFTDSSTDFVDTSVPWELLPDDSNGTWNFSDSQLGDNGFSWVDFDASRGTDYNIGQATVASISGPSDFSLEVPQPTPSISPLVNFDSMLQNTIGFNPSNSISSPTSQLLPQNAYTAFAIPSNPPDSQPMSLDMDTLQHPEYNPPHLDSFASAPSYSTVQIPPVVRSCCAGSNHLLDSSNSNWSGIDPFLTHGPPNDLRSTIPAPNSPPIANGA